MSKTLKIRRTFTLFTMGTQRGPQDITHIAHISPVAWQHINFYGRYEFTKASEIINMEEIVEALAHHPIISIVDEAAA